MNTLPSRIERLETCLAQCRHQLQTQAETLTDLRRGASILRSQSQGMHDELSQLSTHVEILGEKPAQPPQRPSRLLQLIPYIVLLTIGLDFGLKDQSPPPPAATLSSTLPRPAIAQARPQAEDSRKNEAMRLLYEYRLPGTDWDMLDLIGSQEAILGPSPWTMECVSENLCTVSFTAEPLYKFEVNLAAKTVSPTKETIEKLFLSSFSRTAKL